MAHLQSDWSVLRRLIGNVNDEDLILVLHICVQTLFTTNPMNEVDPFEAS
jgi:hypothetical protein